MPCVFSQRMICEGKASGGASSGEFTAYEAGSYEFFYLMNGCDHTHWSLKVTVNGKDENGNDWSKSFTAPSSGDTGVCKGSVEFPASGTYKVTFTATATQADQSTDKEPVGVIVFGDVVRGPLKEVTCIDMVKDTTVELGRTTSTDAFGQGEIVKGSDFGDNPTQNFYYAGYKYDSCTEATVTAEGATVYRYFVSESNKLTVDPAGGTWKNNPDKQVIPLQEGATQDIPLPTREGYIFKGWTLVGKGSTMTSLVGPSTFTMGTEDAILTANWEAIPDEEPEPVPELKGELEISKTGEYLKGTKTKDDGTIEPFYEEDAIQGVEFEIYAKEDIYSQDNKRKQLYKKDQLVAKVITDQQGKAYQSNLPIGKYYVKEAKTVEGFILNKEIKEFEIENDGQETAVQKVEISYKNERQKIDLNGKEGLKVEKIADKTVYQPGEKITYTIIVSNSSEYTIKDIRVEETMIEGKFEDIETENVTKTGDITVEIKELKAGEKVELKFIVEIAEDEKMAEKLETEKIKITNKVEAKGKIEKPGSGLEDIEGEAEEEVYITNKKLVVIKEALKEEYQIGETAQYVIKVMNNGKEDITKILIEEQMLDGRFVYLEETNRNGVEIAGEGQKVAISRLKPGETVILRYEYDITESTKVILSEDQKMILTNTVIGKGKVEKPDPEDDGKIITEDVEDESTEEVRVVELDKNHIGIIKKDIETGKTIQGATIGLYSGENIKDKQGNTIIEKDTLIEKAVTNEWGKAKYSVDLPLGRYYIKEIEAPIGYNISQEIIEIDGTYKGPEIELISVSKTLGNTKIREEEKVVDFAVEKTLSRIILNGQDIEITNNKLAKLEIKTSQLKNTELIASYNIKVTNKGEGKGKITVLETIPDGYEISEAPEYWTTRTDGTLQTEVELEVGESKDLSITLRWTNNETNLGSRTNRAQIEGQEDDINPEDNISEATIVVNIKTGEKVSIIIIGMIMIALMIAGYITYIVIQRKGPGINRIRFLK